MNNAAMNIHVQASVWTSKKIFLCGYLLRCRIAGSCTNLMFNHLRKCQVVFQSGCTILQSHQQCNEGSNFSIPSPILVIVHLFVIAVLMNVSGFDLHFPNH